MPILNPDTIMGRLEEIRNIFFGAGLFTAKGDTLAGDSGGVPDVLPVGADRQVLGADSGAPLGVAWAAFLTPLGAHTVGTVQVAVAHGLAYTPSIVLVTMTSAGQIHKSAATDATNVYFIADAAARTAEVWVR